MGEEAFRGVAICCFCCPAVETVGSYSQAPSFELEQSDFCVSMYEAEREAYTESSHKPGSVVLFLLYIDHF